MIQYYTRTRENNYREIRLEPQYRKVLTKISTNATTQYAKYIDPVRRTNVTHRDKIEFTL